MTTYTPSTIPELLPWADPYIADLHRQHARELHDEGIAADSSGLNCRIRASNSLRPFHGESRLPERTIRSHRSSARAW
jgi:hypothetical protein